MSEHPAPREKLLAELFQGDWAEGPAGGFARAAAAHARRRRRLRRGLTGAGAVAAVASLLVFGSIRRGGPGAEPLSHSARTATYDVISDEELLTRMHDRPVLVLPQQDGTKKIVLLDH